MIPEEESIDNAFAKFNTIITSLKALDDVYEEVIKKDSETVKNKREQSRSIALKARKESSDEDSSTSDSEDEEYAMACGDPNHLIGECPKQLKYQNQRAFVGGAWSDSDDDEEEKTKERKSVFMAKDSNETRAEYGSGVTRPKIEDKDNFELKGQFLKELRTNIFSGSGHEDANEHIEKVLEIVDLFHIPNITIDQVMLREFPISLIGAFPISLTGSITTWDGLKTNFLNKYCPHARTAKKMEEITNFQQELDENLYQAWERFKELLMKCPQHYLTEIHMVILFYNGLGIPTRQIIDSRGVIPSNTIANAKIAIQEMAEYSQKWHNGTSRSRSTESSDGLATIQAQLNYLGREIKKVNKKVYAAQCPDPRLRERIKFDLEARLIGETLVLNRSLDPFFEDYIELNNLNELFELRRNQGDDLMPTIEECEAKFFPLLYVNVMSLLFHNSIMKDKMVYKGNNVIGALMNVPIFVGTFSVVTDFAVLENMDEYRDEGIYQYAYRLVGVKRVLKLCGSSDAKHILVFQPSIFTVDNEDSTTIHPDDLEEHGFEGGTLIYLTMRARIFLKNTGKEAELANKRKNWVLWPLGIKTARTRSQSEGLCQLRKLLQMPLCSLGRLSMGDVLAMMEFGPKQRVYTSIDDFVYVNESASESIVEKPTIENNKPKTARKEDGALIIKDWVSESEEMNGNHNKDLQDNRMLTDRDAIGLMTGIDPILPIHEELMRNYCFKEVQGFSDIGYQTIKGGGKKDVEDPGNEDVRLKEESMLWSTTGFERSRFPEQSIQIGKGHFMHCIKLREIGLKPCNLFALIKTFEREDVLLSLSRCWHKMVSIELAVNSHSLRMHVKRREDGIFISLRTSIVNEIA
ncbi:retrovirus-related pol polyprotein from transposon TNT 1-94 [Tanacetum coccineum]